MHRNLRKFSDCRGFVNNCQYGFGKRLDTTDALIKFMFEIYNNIQENPNFTAVFLDLSNAFYTVNIDILLNKIDHIGVKSSAKHWFGLISRLEHNMHL